MLKFDKLTNDLDIQKGESSTKTYVEQLFGGAALEISRRLNNIRKLSIKSATKENK